jgi:hypothetical protein
VPSRSHNSLRQADMKTYDGALLRDGEAESTGRASDDCDAACQLPEIHLTVTIAVSTWAHVRRVRRL